MMQKDQITFFHKMHSLNLIWDVQFKFHVDLEIEKSFTKNIFFRMIFFSND